MRTMSAPDGIRRLKHSADSRCDRFLTDIQMTESAYLAQAIRLRTFFFEAPDQDHLVKDIHQGVAVVC